MSRWKPMISFMIHISTLLKIITKFRVLHCVTMLHLFKLCRKYCQSYFLPSFTMRQCNKSQSTKANFGTFQKIMGASG